MSKTIYDDENGSLTRVSMVDLIKDKSYEELVKMRDSGGEFMQKEILAEIAKREARELMKKIGSGKKFPDLIGAIALLDSPMGYWLSASFFDADMHPIPVSKVIQVELSRKHCPSADETGRFNRMRHFAYIDHRDALLHRIEDLVGTCAVERLGVADFGVFIKLHENTFLKFIAERHLLSLNHKSESTVGRKTL